MAGSALGEASQGERVIYRDPKAQNPCLGTWGRRETSKVPQVRNSAALWVTDGASALLCLMVGGGRKGKDGTPDDRRVEEKGIQRRSRCQRAFCVSMGWIASARYSRNSLPHAPVIRPPPISLAMPNGVAQDIEVPVCVRFPEQTSDSEGE